TASRHRTRPRRSGWPWRAGTRPSCACWPIGSHWGWLRCVPSSILLWSFCPARSAPPVATSCVGCSPAACGTSRRCIRGWCRPRSRSRCCAARSWRRWTGPGEGCSALLPNRDQQNWKRTLQWYPPTGRKPFISSTWRSAVARTRVLTALFAAASLAMTACGDGGGGNEADEVPQQSGPATIRLWLNGPDTPEPMRQWLKAEFEKRNPGSKLVIEEQQWEGLVDKLTTSLGSAKETPDVVEVGNTQAATFTTVGAFEDITDLVPKLGGDDLLPSFVEAGSADGKVYAVPLYAGSAYVFYRKDLFAKS